MRTLAISATSHLERLRGGCPEAVAEVAVEWLIGLEPPAASSSCISRPSSSVLSPDAELRR